MFQNKKTWRKVLLPICCLGILFFGVGGWKFQSVHSYKEEQEKLRQESDSTHVENEPDESEQKKGSQATALPDGGTKLANGGELVTPTVPQRAVGNGDANQSGDFGAGSENADGTDTVSEATGMGTAKDGGNDSSAKNSDKKKDSGGTKGTDAQIPSAGNAAGEKRPANSGNQQQNGKTETVYNPQRTPSPIKEPREGMVTGTVTIDCTSILDNMDALDENLHGFVPSSGYIVKGQSFRLKEGDNAYMALQAVCRELDIQLDASFTPLYNSFYINGIGYLYEKSAGRKSGWLYSVNGEKPKVSASAYTLREGDQVSFMYTCNGGNDVK